MNYANLQMVCNRCDVPLQIEDHDDEQSRVQCPVCGKDFGTWRHVRTNIPRKIGEAFRDRESWRAAIRPMSAP